MFYVITQRDRYGSNKRVSYRICHVQWSNMNPRAYNYVPVHWLPLIWSQSNIHTRIQVSAELCSLSLGLTRLCANSLWANRTVSSSFKSPWLRIRIIIGQHIAASLHLTWILSIYAPLHSIYVRERRLPDQHKMRPHLCNVQQSACNHNLRHTNTHRHTHKCPSPSHIAHWMARHARMIL